MTQPCFTDKLSTAINSGCQNQTVGVEKRAIVIPRSLVNNAAIAFDSGTVVINTFGLTTPGTGGEYVTDYGEMPFKATKVDGEKGEYKMKFLSTFGFIIMGNSPDKVKQVMQLQNDEHYVILQNISYSAAEKNKYMLLAPTKGMTTRKAAFSMENQDAYGWAIEMIEDGALLPVSFIWASSGEAATDALIALLVA